MNPALESVCAALEQLAERIKSHGKVLFRSHGWNHPAMTSHDVSEDTLRLAAKIKAHAPQDIDASLAKSLAESATELNKLSETIPYFFNGHSHLAVPIYLESIQIVERRLSPLWEWQAINDPKSMPAQLAKRVRSYRAEIDALASEIPAIESKLKTIKDAHDAAESLPVDLAGLKAAREVVENATEEIAAAETEAKQNLEALQRTLVETTDLKRKAVEIMKECEDALRMTTSRGLASSFYTSSARLNTSVRWWVGALAVTLVGGSVVGGFRIHALNELLKNPTPQWGVIWINIVLSLISVGAPIWFAWLATKQIGQRFRLAEDYEYKAAVSQAYEGFRREAAKHSPEFAEQLLGSALTRLDEPPLRWVEIESHGSPWHEFINSEAFEQALKLVPNFKESYAAAKSRRSTKRASLRNEESIAPATSA